MPIPSSRCSSGASPGSSALLTPGGLIGVRLPPVIAGSIRAWGAEYPEGNGDPA